MFKSFVHTFVVRPIALVLLTVTAPALVLADMSPQQIAVVERLRQAAKAADLAFTEFSADRGKALFTGTHSGGKVNSCTSCHTTNLTQPGKTRAGKEIAPMAASVNPKRFTDPADVEKWFKRNCTDVLGRECTSVEKGDVLTYLLGL